MLIVVIKKEGGGDLVRQVELPLPGPSGYAVYIGYEADKGTEFTAEISIKIKNKTQ